MGALPHMPLGRRRQEQAAEAQALSAARAAVANIVACFCSDPDDYEVRASIAIGNDSSGVNVLHFQWDDEAIRETYFLEGDVTAVNRSRQGRTARPMRELPHFDEPRMAVPVAPRRH